MLDRRLRVCAEELVALFPEAVDRFEIIGAPCARPASIDPVKVAHAAAPVDEVEKALRVSGRQLAAPFLLR
jgi:hypothetical protein